MKQNSNRNTIDHRKIYLPVSTNILQSRGRPTMTWHCCKTCRRFLNYRENCRARNSTVALETLATLSKEISISPNPSSTWKSVNRLYARCRSTASLSDLRQWHSRLAVHRFRQATSMKGFLGNNGSMLRRVAGVSSCRRFSFDVSRISMDSIKKQCDWTVCIRSRVQVSCALKGAFIGYI